MSATISSLRDQIDGIVFDLDGTLVDSASDIATAINHALTELGANVVSIDQVRSWIGDGLPELCRRAAKFIDRIDEWSEIEMIARARYLECCTDTTDCYPDIRKALADLRRAEIPLAILSNKPHDMVLRVVSALDLDPLFVSARGYISEETKKPSPKGALDLAKSMSIAPERLLMVGDSIVDISTARNAGMRSVAVLWGLGSAEVLRAAGPDFVIERPGELTAFLGV